MSAKSGTWTAFQPLGYEPDLRPALKALKQIDWVFPKIEGENLGFFRPHADEEKAFAEGEFGIMEPHGDASERVNLADIRGFLIPGLAFDQHGNRLGRGRGYYDRMLGQMPNVELGVTKIGIAFDQQVTAEAIPTEDFDQPMDFVITESKIYNRSQRKSS